MGLTLETDELIQRLAKSARPIRPLPPPWKRTVYWLSIALPAVAAVVVLASPRDDLAERLVDARFLIEQAAAFTTVVTAAAAAFTMVVPGQNRTLAFLPLAPLGVWLGSLGQGWLVSWLRAGDTLKLANDWLCFPGIAITGAIPALAMMAMLRRGVPLAPRMTAMLGALAAAALGNFGLRLFHLQDASITVLIWQFGSVALLTALNGLMGGAILGWRHAGHM